MSQQVAFLARTSFGKLELNPSAEVNQPVCCTLRSAMHMVWLLKNHGYRLRYLKFHQPPGARHAPKGSRAGSVFIGDPMSIILIKYLVQLARQVIRRYYLLMDKIIRQGDKEVRVFRTPDGVTGIVDTSVPMPALDGLAAKLEQRLAARAGTAKFALTPFGGVKPIAGSSS